jgi:hypothetical protein
MMVVLDSIDESNRGAENVILTPLSDMRHNDGTVSNSQADDDKDSQKINCLFDIWIKCESEHQMHRLAQEYYQFRENLFHFLPVTALTMASGILAFMATSENFDSQTENFTLWVGILSIVSAAFQSFAACEECKVRC